MTETKRHPLAIAWDEWIASEEGRSCGDVGSLTMGESPMNKYLQNRLHRAFMAGAKVGEPVIKAAQEWADLQSVNVGVYENEQTTTPKV